MKLLCLLLVVACAASPPVRRFEATDKSSVTGVLAAQAAAWNRSDLDGYMAGYAKTDDLVFTSGGKIRRGWQATYDAFKVKYATSPGSMGKLVFEVLEVTPVGADGAIVLGRWTLTEAEHPGTGVFTVVLERRAEGWKIVHDHTSSDAS